MMDCNPAQTLMDKGMKLSVTMSLKTPEEKLAMKNIPYHELVSKLLYLAVTTRLEIAYAISILCHFMENPGMTHWNMAKRLLWYLRGMVDMLLTYSHHSSP